MLNIKDINIFYKNKVSTDENNIEMPANMKALKKLLNHAYEKGLKVAYISYNYTSNRVIGTKINVLNLSPFSLKYKNYFKNSYIRYVLPSPVPNVARDVCFFEIDENFTENIAEVKYLSLKNLVNYYQLLQKKDASLLSSNRSEYFLFSIFNIISDDNVKIKDIHFPENYINRKPLEKPEIGMLDGMAVANYIIEIANKNNIDVTHLKIQKIMFYLQQDFINEFGYPLINADFKYGNYGPYLEEVYHNLSNYGATNIKETQQILNKDFSTTTPLIEKDFLYKAKLYSDVLYLLQYKATYLAQSAMKKVSFDDLALNLGK